jgi:hypothetical protein
MRRQGLHFPAEESVHLPSESILILLARQANVQCGINTQHLNPFVISSRPDSESKQSEFIVEVEQLPIKRVGKNPVLPLSPLAVSNKTKYDM